MKPIIFIGEIGLDAIHLVAIVIALGLAAAIYRLNTQFGQERTTREEAEADLSHAEQELKTQRTQAESARLELAELKGQTAKQREEFSTLAQQVMKQAQAQFVEMADETFKKHREGAKGELSQLMKPIDENFKEFKKRVDTPVKVVIGEPIGREVLDPLAKDTRKMMDFLRKATYELSPTPLKSYDYGYEFEERHRA